MYRIEVFNWTGPDGRDGDYEEVLRTHDRNEVQKFINGIPDGYEHLFHIARYVSKTYQDPIGKWADWELVGSVSADCWEGEVTEYDND